MLEQDSPQSRHWLASAIQTWVRIAQHFPILTIAICIATAGWGLFYTVGRLGFKTDRDDLVNPSDAYAQNWKRYSEEFGGEMDIVVIVGGNDQSAMVAAIESIAREIEGFPNHFDKLCHRIDVEKLRDKGLYQLPLDELRAVQARLEPVRPMLLGSWDWMNIEALTHDARLRIENLPVDRPIDDANRRALLSSASLLESLAAYLEAGNVYHSPWLDPISESAGQKIRNIPEHFFSADGKFAFLRVIPRSPDSTQFVQHRESVQILRNVISRMRPLFPGIEFGLTGLPVLETDEMQATKEGSKWSTVVSALGVLIVFALAFRAFRHPLFAIASLAVAGCWTMGFVTLTVGHLNILTVSFMVTLIGLGIDYGILWISQFEAASAQGRPLREANNEVAATIGPGTLVGAGTTAVAFLATTLHTFSGLRELGWIAAGGVLFCLLAAITFVPALLACAGSPADPQPLRIANPRRSMLPFVARRPKLVACTTFSVAAALATGLPCLKFDYNLLNLQPRGLPSVEWEHRLIQQTGTSGWYALSMANSAEEARRLAEVFQTLPTVGRVIEIASLIPADQPHKMPIVQTIHQALSNLPKPTEVPAQSNPNVPNIQQTLAAIENAPAAVRSDDILIRRVAKAASAATSALARLSIEDSTRRIAKYQKIWLEDLIVQLHGLRSVANPDPVTVRDLPETLVQRFYSPTGKWAIQVFAKGSVWDMAPLQQFRDELAKIDPEITGKPISTVHSLEQMADGFILSGSVALVAILILVWMDLGSFRMAALALVPLLVGGLAMLGTLGWLGIALNPANMIALPLILGIGIDYGVHVMHDFLRAAGTYALPARLGRSLLLNAITTILSFASLALAPHWGMVTIGIALAIGVSTCSLAAIILLPSFLAFLTRNQPEESFDTPAELLDLPSTVYYNRHAA